jgi:hypothetical protein
MAVVNMGATLFFFCSIHGCYDQLRERFPDDETVQLLGEAFDGLAGSLQRLTLTAFPSMRVEEIIEVMAKHVKTRDEEPATT